MADTAECAYRKTSTGAPIEGSIKQGMVRKSFEKMFWIVYINKACD